MAVTGSPGEVRSLAFNAFLFTVIASGCCSSQVPFLMWTSDGYNLPPMASPAAGHITSNSQLVSYLKSALGSAPHTVLLFLQDKLSKDDFTVFGGVFGNKQDSAFPNIEAALQSSSSLVLPSLAWPGSNSIPALLQESLGVSPVLVDPDTLSHLSLNASGSNLLMINLPYNTNSLKSCKEVLQNNDEIIGKALSILKDKNVPYTAIYTGLQPSRVISETSVVNKPVGRSLLQAAAATTVKPPIMFNETSGPCIMLWAESLNVSFNGAESWIDLATQNPTTDGSICNNTYALLVLNYNAGITLSFSMTQRLYPVSGRNWFTLDAVQLQANDTVAFFSGARNIYAPAEYSFHCRSVSSVREGLLVPNSTTGEALPLLLNFIDFQIQGFNLGNSTDFSYASDCAGFFTPGIWMGLLTTLLLVLILVYGLHMIMQLNTMDRFDDPKGPSISVPQSE